MSGLVHNIDASLEAVEEIFAALLDISRLDTGAMKPEMSDFRIDELLARLDVEFAPLARAKGLTLKFMPCSLAVRSDRRLLRRLLQNLVSNAIKYTPQGAVLIGCRRRGSRLRIDVYDTGIGIPQAKRRAVFKEFHRLDHGARVARGVGLGLSIVERIARVLDAEVDDEIDLRPRLALLGRSAARRGRGARGRAGAPRANPPPASSSAPSLLCIDNEPAILDGMRDAARRLGLPRAHGGENLAQALAALDGSGIEPDGLLVDYHLDGANGVGAISELRHRYGAIFRRSCHRRPLARMCARRRAPSGVHILNKPVKPASLRALITQWRVQRVAAE